jgi:asparagine synthetase A
MASWTDFIEALAARRPEIKMVPPKVQYEDIWDQQKRIEALEAEVTYLKSVLVAILNRLNEKE